MTHLPHRLAALALGLSMISPLSACGTDSSVPADAGSSADDSGANTGQLAVEPLRYSNTEVCNVMT